MQYEEQDHKHYKTSEKNNHEIRTDWEELLVHLMFSNGSIKNFRLANTFQHPKDYIHYQHAVGHKDHNSFSVVCLNPE